MNTLEERFNEKFPNLAEPRNGQMWDCGDKVLAFIKSEIEQAKHEAREEMRKVIEKFDVKHGILGEPVNNPLMNIEDAKRLILEELSHLQSPVAPETKP